MWEDQTSGMKSAFYQYIEDVESGKIITNKWIKLAVKRFQSDLEKGEFEFDYDRGERVVRFGRLCNHWKGLYAGKPIDFLGYQQFHLINIFGWIREDGTRRFRRSYFEVAKKNAKTTMNAVKAAFLISKDGQEGGQIYAIATKEDQACLVVNDAGKIIEASPSLRGKFELYRYKEKINRVVYKPTSSFIKPLGKDSDRQDGLDPTTGIVDEYHAFDTDELVNNIQSGMVLRPQPLMDIITTAGFNLQGPCYEFRKYCMDVLEGKIQDDQLFALIYCLDKKDKWDDEKVWIKPNPILSDPVLGDKVVLPYLRQRVQEAKNEGGSKIIDVKTKNLNEWCDAPTAWVLDADWMKNCHNIDPENLLSVPCYGGMDLARTTDMNAFVLYFDDFEGKRAIKWWFWMPEDNVEKLSKRDKVDYRKWVEQGFIITTPGNTADYNFIEKDIEEAIVSHNFMSLGYDPFYAGNVVGNLSDKGIQCHEVRQSFTVLTNPTGELERLATKGILEHFGNPVARWMMGNVMIQRDANGNQKPDKKRENTKIDGISALLNAIADKMYNPQSQDDMKFELV